MSGAVLIDHLQHVHQSAPGRWRAICPAHTARRRTQSLAIRELGDGTLLVHCHAGCEVGHIVAAIGLELRDLFPQGHTAPADPRHPQRPRHWHTIRDALRTLHYECLVCAVAAESIAAGGPISQEDANRVLIAAGRIRAAVDACL